MITRNLADSIRRLFFIQIGNNQSNIAKVNLQQFSPPDFYSVDLAHIEHSNFTVAVKSEQ